MNKHWLKWKFTRSETGGEEFIVWLCVIGLIVGIVYFGVFS